MKGEREVMEKICHQIGEGSGGYFRNPRLKFERKRMYKVKVVNVPNKVVAQ